MSQLKAEATLGRSDPASRFLGLRLVMLDKRTQQHDAARRHLGHGATALTDQQGQHVWQHDATRRRLGHDGTVPTAQQGQQRWQCKYGNECCAVG